MGVSWQLPRTVTACRRLQKPSLYALGNSHVRRILWYTSNCFVYIVPLGYPQNVDNAIEMIKQRLKGGMPNVNTRAQTMDNFKNGRSFAAVNPSFSFG